MGTSTLGKRHVFPQNEWADDIALNLLFGTIFHFLNSFLGVYITILQKHLISEVLLKYFLLLK
jgi:hypothetical protein